MHTGSAFLLVKTENFKQEVMVLRIQTKAQQIVLVLLK